jgi:dipeptidyl-peptidase 4
MMKPRIVKTLILLMLAMPALLYGQKLLTIDDLSSPSLFPAPLRNLQWLPVQNKFSFIKDNTLMIGQPDQKEDQSVVTLQKLNESLTEAGLGTTKRFPEITWLNEDLFRFMYGNTLVTYSLANQQCARILDWPKGTDNAEFDPTGLGVAYTMDDNVYITTIQNTTRVTSDGGNGIVNGRTVHRNEFGISNGIFWSPMGNKLAFYRKDESMVTQYPLVNTDARVAEVNYIRYPMAGMTSEQVTVGIYEIGSGAVIFIKSGEPADQFLTNVTWSPDETAIYIAVLNRAQNYLKLNRYNATTGELESTIFEEKSDYYVEPEHGPLFIPNRSDQFIWQSERNGWNHIYLYDITGKLLKRFTSGNWMVTSVDGFDPFGNLLYFYSTEVSPIESHYFVYDLKKDKITRITSVNGTHNVKRSFDGKFYIDQYSNYNGIAFQTDLLDQKGKVVKTLLANNDPLKEYLKAEIRIDTLLASDSTRLYYRMILPPGFDPSKKYPVFFYLYGGPHNQLVTNSWLGGAGLFLLSMAHKGYIVFSMDNRGSANRGFYFESIIHRKVGKIESEDQMKGVEFLRSLPYVDAGRMCIHGWSYGGFMTITMMQRYPDVFKVAVAGGPVIDWKYYEVMYGERYMDTPEENPMGYQESSLMNSIDSLKGRLLIIQGTMDDVVVWQHSQQYLKESVAKKKLVDYYIYPGHEHNVRGTDRIHLYRKIDQYISDHL